MKEIFIKISSVLLALTVLLSTVSITINKHYCGEVLVDSAMFVKAEACGMEMKMDTNSSECSIKKKNCCSNEQILIEGQDELKLTFSDFSLDQQLFVAAFYITYIDLFEGLEEHVVPFDDYAPPLVTRDIQKLQEVYLI